MSLSDPIGDLFTRIRNGQAARLTAVSAPFSNYAESILDVLKREGYIRAYTKSANDRGHNQLDVELKYDSGLPVIREIQRVSKPGRRVYTPVKKLEKFYNGLGVFILSTPRGVLSDREAREQNVGGEIVGKVF